MTHNAAAQPRTDWRRLLSEPSVRQLVELALLEDIGTGDVTSLATIDEDAIAQAQIVARKATVCCGTPLAQHVFTGLDETAGFNHVAPEGADLEPGGVLMRVRMKTRALLTAERCVLNFLMRLCGIAATARRAVQSLPPGSHAKIYDTRKTTPGLRLLEKAAVATGGAENHRIGLFDAVLIKDNHVAAAGSVAQAILRARAFVGTHMPVEVEIDTLDQLDEALSARPDIILLDNFDLGEIREAVARTAGRAQLEVSGSVRHEQLAAIAATGVDRISMGALTHSALPADLSLEVLV